MMMKITGVIVRLVAYVIFLTAVIELGPLERLLAVMGIIMVMLLGSTPTRKKFRNKWEKSGFKSR